MRKSHDYRMIRFKFYANTMICLLAVHGAAAVYHLAAYV